MLILGSDYHHVFSLRDGRHSAIDGESVSATVMLDGADTAVPVTITDTGDNYLSVFTVPEHWSESVEVALRIDATVDSISLSKVYQLGSTVASLDQPDDTYLELIKMHLKVTHDRADTLIQHYIRQADADIKNYVGYEDISQMQPEYEKALMLMVEHMYYGTSAYGAELLREAAEHILFQRKILVAY